MTNSKQIIFIAPAANRRVNVKHFIGYTPGGEGGGKNYDAFPDFERHVFFEPTPQCVPLVKGAVGDFTWDAEWRLASGFEINLRTQMHWVVRHLEEHPLSEQEYERLLDLAASGPLLRKELDNRIEKLGLVQEYDSEAEESAVECTDLLVSQAYGRYHGLPYNGQLLLPYVDVHKKLCNMTQHTVLLKVTEALQPELIKEWLQGIEPEAVIGHTGKRCGCPLATYILERLKLEVEVGNSFDLSSFSYEGVMHNLPDWAWGYASNFDEFTISEIDAETVYEDDDDMYNRFPNYPSVPVKAKHALTILKSYENRYKDLV